MTSDPIRMCECQGPPGSASCWWACPGVNVLSVAEGTGEPLRVMVGVSARVDLVSWLWHVGSGKDRDDVVLVDLPAFGRPPLGVCRHAKEVIRSIYEITDCELADEFVSQLAEDLQDDTLQPDANSLGRTLRRWHDQIVAWHQARISNGPTEAINNLIKRIKRVGFGFRRFQNYRIRVLFYAGRPNWNLLATIAPR